MGSLEFYNFLVANPTEPEHNNLLMKYTRAEILSGFRIIERERKIKKRNMKNEEGGSEGKDAVEEETSIQKKFMAQKKRKARMIEKAAKNLYQEQTLDENPEQMMDQALEFLYSAYEQAPDEEAQQKIDLGILQILEKVYEYEQDIQVLEQVLQETKELKLKAEIAYEETKEFKAEIAYEETKEFKAEIAAYEETKELTAEKAYEETKEVKAEIAAHEETKELTAEKVEA